MLLRIILTISKKNPSPIGNWKCHLKMQGKRKHLALKDKLLSATRENTELLKEIAALKEQHMKIEEAIKDAASYKKKPNRTRRSVAASEKSKMLALANRQEREIELLNLEIKSFKTKCGKWFVTLFIEHETHAFCGFV